MNSLSLPIDSFLLVPGNHDIDRNQVNKFAEKYIKQELDKTSIFTIDDKFEEDFELNRLKDFFMFEKKLFESDKDRTFMRLGSHKLLNSELGNISISCINNSWRCYDDTDSGNLLISKEQLDDFEDLIIKNKPVLKIALMHHPLDDIHQSEQRIIKSQLQRMYNFLLFGHSHSSSTEMVISGTGNKIIPSMAPSNWSSNILQSDNHRNGYTIFNIIDNKLNYDIEIEHRMYSYEKKKFIPNTDLGEDDSNISRYKIAKEVDERWSEICRHISPSFDNFIEKTSTILVSYNSDSCASEDIDDLYVPPTIYQVEKKSDKKMAINTSLDNIQKKMSFDDIINSNESFILTGPKEIGKTTVLRTLFDKVYSNIYSSSCLPIYIDSNTANSIDISKNISDFLNYSKNKTKNILKDYQAILFLDNLKFDNSQRSINTIEQINKLISDFPKLKIVASSTTFGSELSVSDFIETNFPKDFKVLRIDYFKMEQIRSLMNNWFSQSPDFDSIQLDSLVNNFQTLNIPSTPLSVSLFLWIFEKDTNAKPINSANLIRTFLEKTFEKHSDIEYYSGTFNFDNKEHLLSKIAYKMLITEDKNYRINKKDLIYEIDSYLENSRNTLPAYDANVSFSEWCITYFIQKGILIEDVKSNKTFYRFKLNCFFGYYLSKYMALDDDFKSDVLSINNYFSYIEEIDYYSGIVRTDSDVLERLLDNMNNTFKGILTDMGASSTFLDSAINKKEINFIDLLKSDPEKSFSNTIINSKTKEEEIDQLLDSTVKTTKEKDLEDNTILEISNSTYESGRIPTKANFDEIPFFSRLQNSWILTARVLRNLDNVEKGSLKDEAFEEIIFFSLLSTSLMTFILNKSSRESDSELDEILNVFSRITLFFQNSLLFDALGSSKVAGLIKSEMSKYDDNSIEFLYLSMLYNDVVNTHESRKLFKKAIRKNNSKFLKDNILFKLFELKSKSTDNTSSQFYSEEIKYLLMKNKKGIPYRNHMSNHLDQELKKSN